MGTLRALTPWRNAGHTSCKINFSFYYQYFTDSEPPGFLAASITIESGWHPPIPRPGPSRPGFLLEAAVTDYCSTEFIIGADEDNTPLTRVCNPDLLSVPHYLTSVWFTPDVLNKYRDDPEKYSLEEDYLCQGSEWCMGFFRNRGLVGVHLGDLGRDLPYSERGHWRSHNVLPPTYAPVSSIRGKDRMFRMKFMRLQRAWLVRFGWSLFRPVGARVLAGISLPQHGGRRKNVFHHTINCLCKTIIDAINISELARITGVPRRGAKPIETLTAWLRYRGGPDPSHHILFLEALNTIRVSLAEGAKAPYPCTPALNNVFDCADEFVDFLADTFGLWPPED